MSHRISTIVNTLSHGPLMQSLYRKTLGQCNIYFYNRNLQCGVLICSKQLMHADVLHVQASEMAYPATIVSYSRKSVYSIGHKQARLFSRKEAIFTIVACWMFGSAVTFNLTTKYLLVHLVFK